MKTQELSQAEHGDLKRSYVFSEAASSLFLFDDLSLHSYDRNAMLWTREEAMSQITQIEIFDHSQLTLKRDFPESELTEMQKMREPVGFADVPNRILQRRIENLNIIYNSIVSFFKDS